MERRLDAADYIVDVNIPGFPTQDVDELDNDAGDDPVNINADVPMVTSTARADTATTTGGGGTSLTSVLDLDGVVISVFAVAVILLVVGQTLIVCRQRRRRRCPGPVGCHKWSTRSMAWRLHGGRQPVCRRAHVTQEIWNALPPSPVAAADPFNVDSYRTPAFAYINCRTSNESVQSIAARHPDISASDSGASSTTAMFVGTAPSVTWSDVGEQTSSSPDKTRPTSSSLSSSDVGDATTRRPQFRDSAAQTDDDDGSSGGHVFPVILYSGDDDVTGTSSVSIGCSTSDTSPDSVNLKEDHGETQVAVCVVHFSADDTSKTDEDNERGAMSTIDRPSSEPDSRVVKYVQLATDDFTFSPYGDSENSSC